METGSRHLSMYRYSVQTVIRENILCAESHTETLPVTFLQPTEFVQDSLQVSM